MLPPKFKPKAGPNIGMMLTKLTPTHYSALVQDTERQNNERREAKQHYLRMIP